MKFIACLLLVATPFAWCPRTAWPRAESEAILIRGSTGGDVWHFVQEVCLVYGDYRAEPTVTACIRISSDDALPLALFTAPASPFGVQKLLSDEYAYPCSRIVFAVTNQWDRAKYPLGTTEAWLVPGGASLPASSDTLGACELRVTDFAFGADVRTPAEAARAVEKLASYLQMNPAAIGVVRAQYYVSDPRHAKTRSAVRARERIAGSAAATEAALGRAGISGDRIKICVVPHAIYGDDVNPQPAYCDLYAVELMIGGTHP